MRMARVENLYQQGDAWVFTVSTDEPGFLAGVLALFLQSIPLDERQWDSTRNTWTVRRSGVNARRLAALFDNFTSASDAPPAPPAPPNPQPSLFDGA